MLHGFALHPSHVPDSVLFRRLGESKDGKPISDLQPSLRGRVLVECHEEEAHLFALTTGNYQPYQGIVSCDTLFSWDEVPDRHHKEWIIHLL